MVFAGPSAECIESFGIKHTARELALKADVPIVPGTKGLVKSEDEAVEEAKKMGFPVK
jgi:urea carboxylase